VHYADFLSLGKPTSGIGLGCGRLVGRSSLRQSSRLVETALELGIRYFDVAPSYGLGTAEEVLGEVIGPSTEVTIATKVGIPRPQYSARTNLVRRAVKPVLDRQRHLKTIAKSVTRSESTEPRPRYEFSAEAVRASLLESLEKLRRESVDVFLAHEPRREDLSEEVEEHFRRLVQEGRVSTFGAGVDARGDRWERFGSVWQSRWPGESARGYRNDIAHVFHGVVRSRSERGSGGAVESASSLLRAAVEQAPSSIILVSASTPDRLRDLLSELE
jgi:aryl-alcohol dehydrogenase-like predicted oxidoreductase